MSLSDLDRAKLKLILKTSQGFPAQFESSKARIIDPNGIRRLSSSRSGHAISSHIRGASSSTTQYKTRFCSLDDMAHALELVLNTALGRQVIESLHPGAREKVLTTINCAFPIEAGIDGFGTVTFTTSDISIAHINVHYFALLEARDRSGDTHLHVHTFYPKVSPSEIEQLLDAKTRP